MVRLLTVLLYALSYIVNGATEEEAIKKLISDSRTATDSILTTIFDRWEIKEFPSFLESVAMSHTSWEILKAKYELKILSTSDAEKKPQFVISFMGSSVTAGHDTKFDLSFSELTRSVMKPAFDAVGVELIVRNGAMGNNPCMPYDACVRTFAGPDADIVHWEQVKCSIIFLEKTFNTLHIIYFTIFKIIYHNIPTFPTTNRVITVFQILHRHLNYL